ncbi:MAG: amidase [Dehalococcoidia bacterium]
MPNELWKLDATAQAALVRAGDVTSAELVESAIGRIERLNPQINAVIMKFYDEARRSAENVDRSGPFAGVPMLVKDACLQIEGLPYYLGTRVLRDLDHRSTHTTELARRFDRAGFVVLGKTNVPAMSSGVTEPLAFGATHNPWDLTRSPSGSSGGSAAAVASGMTSIAHGSDAGDSLRYPASVCGLATLKPSRGRVPSGTPTGDPDTSGIWAEFVLARSVRDLAGVLDAVHGPVSGTSLDALAPSRPYVDEIDHPAALLRVGVMTIDVSSGMKVDPECAAAVERTGALLASLGHRVDAAHPPALDGLYTRILAALNVRSAVYRPDSLRWLESTVGRPITADDVEPALLAEWTSAAGAVTAEKLAEANALIAREIAPIEEWWRGHDLLITPTTLQPAWPLGATGFDVGTFPVVWSMNGQPAMSLPMHWAPFGLPCGVQFVAAHGRDDLLLNVAAQLEQAAPWVHRWPPIAME